MKKGFTLIELVFVIVIVGILAKFGTNILLTTYTGYAASTANNKISADTELALKQIANRLQYRIKDSVIVRANAASAANAFVPLQAVGNERLIEWIGYDIDGWLGSGTATNPPNWSGFIDVENAAAIASQATANPYLESPGTSTAAITTTVADLANGSATTVSDTAIFFTGANSNVMTDFGYTGAIANQFSAAAHPVGITVTPPPSQTFLYDTTAAPSTFTGTDIYENYKLAWTAYAIAAEDYDNDGGLDLVLYYDFQPWNGGGIPPVNDVGRRKLLLQNINSFSFRAIGDTINIQICVDEQDALGEGDGGYALCQEVAVF